MTANTATGGQIRKNESNPLAPATPANPAARHDGGTTWTGMGFPSTTCSEGGSSIALNPVDNKPIVIYAEYLGGDGAVHVGRYPYQPERQS